MNQWQDAEQHFERAMDLVRQRKWPQALSELRRATRVNPFNGQWQFHLGLVLDEMGRYDQALRAYRRAARLEPNSLQIQERLAADLHRVGRLRQALRAFQNISHADPSHEPAYCHRLLIHVELGEHDLAEEMFYTARLYKDHCPRCYDYMGRSLAVRGLYKRAIYCFQRCLDMEATWPDAWRRLAEVFWNKGETEQARRHYLADLRQNPGRVQTLLDLGDLLLEMGRFDEAGEKYRLCIELAPQEAEGYLRYGRWLMRRRKDDEAQLAFAEALRRNPTVCGAHLELARLALARGDRAQTRKELKAEHLVSTDDAQILLGLANIWMDCGGYRTAIACLKRLVALQPECRDAWLNLAVAQFRRGLYRHGIRSCQQALELEPGNRLALYNLAVAHERMGEYEAALQWAGAALKLQPRDVVLQRLEFRLRVLRWWGAVLARVRLGRHK